MFAELIIGIILAGVSILLIQVFPSGIHQKIYAIALMIAASIYVIFSSLSNNINWVFIELSGVILFGVIAFLGVKFSPWFLAIGWFAHPVWDLLIDNHTSSIFVPQWYPTICIGYDLAIALYIVWECSTSRALKADV